MADLRAEGPRVRLRPVRDADLPLIEGLLGAGPASELLVITLREEGRPIGVLQYRPDEPSEGWATIDHVAVAEDSRRWGLGQDAARLLEAAVARECRVRHFRTTIDVRNGLALYFWLRLGYRPLGPFTDSQGHDVLPLIRETASG